MIETVVFLLGQLLINIAVWKINKPTVTYYFANLSYIIFGLLLFFYPYWSYRLPFTSYYYHPSIFKCGLMQIGPVFFQWIIGGVLSVILQNRFNARIHKIQEFE